MLCGSIGYPKARLVKLLINTNKHFLQFFFGNTSADYRKLISSVAVQTASGKEICPDGIYYTDQCFVTLVMSVFIIYHLEIINVYQG